MPDEAERVQLLCLDVDGVLTDGGLYMDDHGVETKRFHVRDGAGLRMWMRVGGARRADHRPARHGGAAQGR